jgi:voltage-gated potassium channel
MLSRDRGRRVEQALRVLEWPLALLALAVIPALFLEDSPHQVIYAIARGVNWFVWLAFLGEFVARIVIAPKRWEAVKQRWLDLLIIVVSPPCLVPDSFQTEATTVRALRLIRLLRAVAVAAIGVRSGRRVLAERRLIFVGTTALVTVCAGALAVFRAEEGTNGSITSLGDAFWWAVVTATTIGTAEMSPVTWEGRAIAVCLMLIAIGIIGVFTATLASAFLDRDEAPKEDDLAARLDAIETKLDLLLTERGQKSEMELAVSG